MSNELNHKPEPYLLCGKTATGDVVPWLLGADGKIIVSGLADIRYWAYQVFKLSA